MQDYELENDFCNKAKVIPSIPYQLSDTTIGALPDFNVDTCGVKASAGGVWYTYTSTETKAIKVFVDRTSGSSRASRAYLRVFSGGDCGDLTCVGNSGGSYSGDASYTFTAQAGVTYKFLVSTYEFALGVPEFTISVQEQ